jgi:hypothetical protein
LLFTTSLTIGTVNLSSSGEIPAPKDCNNGIAVVDHGKPASWQASIPTSKPAGLSVILLGNSKFTLCLIKDIIVRYEEGEQIGLKFKNAWRNQEYETK